MPVQFVSMRHRTQKRKRFYVVESRETLNITFGIVQISLRLVYFDGHLFNGRTMS